MAVIGNYFAYSHIVLSTDNIIRENHNLIGRDKREGEIININPKQNLTLFRVFKIEIKMWPDDIFWLPKMLKGELIKATFKFGEGDVILDKKVEVVGDFSK